MERKRRTSLKDLAERLGVSIATISRALRDSHEVSPAMREKVKLLAEQLNYRPNPFAQGLRTEGPKAIGVVLPNLVTHYYAAVLDGIEDFAIRNGYTVISANSHEDQQREAAAIDNFINLHVGGIIACLSQQTSQYNHFLEANKLGIPLVFFARTCMQDRFSSVTGDGDVAAQRATEHLIETGSRRIAFIGGPNHLDMVQRRKHGYLEALREHRLPIDRDIICCDLIDKERVRQTVVALLRSDNRPDAILAFNDIIMYAVFETVKELGLRIPEDVAIIGFSDSETSRLVTPKLSVIQDQAHLQGERACDLLLRQINGDTEIVHEQIPMLLQIRESSAKK